MASSERYKGQDVLLRSFPALHAEFPDAQLVLAGQGDDYTRLLTMARSLPGEVQSAVFMPGYVSDAELDLLYHLCYVFAMPSSNEGFGLVYLEAMSHGKPCVGGKLDATPCVVRDGMTGVLVDNPREPGEVTVALATLLSDPERASAMGQAGHNLVQSHYLYRHFRQRFWQALDHTSARHFTDRGTAAQSQTGAES
jgi:phosphatidylinositol alpha-1,6-mannosyltransferase